MNLPMRAGSFRFRRKNQCPLANELPTPTPYHNTADQVVDLLFQEFAVLLTHFFGRALEEEYSGSSCISSRPAPCLAMSDAHVAGPSVVVFESMMLRRQ